MSKEYTTPQPAPWKVGTKLRYTGDSISGFPDDRDYPVWSHTKGVIYTVTKVSPTLGTERVLDEETGEYYTNIYHGWNTLQSELDPDLKHGKAIDVDSMHDYEIVRA